MPETGVLRLELVDVYGERLRERVDIQLRHERLTHSPFLRDKDAAREIVIRGLHRAPQGRYRVDVDPASYLAVSHTVQIEASGETSLRLVFPVDPKKVVRVDFPDYEQLPQELRDLLEASDQVEDQGGRKGKDLYRNLDPLRRAGLLNVAAKSLATVLSNKKSVLPYVSKLTQLRGDRFYCSVKPELRGEVKHSRDADIFHDAPSILHSAPADYSHDGSFKTHDRYGNLQVTFFKKGEDSRADIDVDEAAGLGHVFQVLRNLRPGRSTHPYDVQQILIHHQKLDPGYRLVVRT